MSDLNKVKNYLKDLNLDITSENQDDEILVINDESKGIQNMILDCESPILTPLFHLIFLIMMAVLSFLPQHKIKRIGEKICPLSI